MLPPRSSSPKTSSPSVQPTRRANRSRAVPPVACSKRGSASLRRAARARGARRLGVLAEILAEKAENIAELRRRKLPAPPPRRPFSLYREPNAALGLIAEIKFRSPSAGALSTALTVSARAAAYERGGARMLSVLTDRRFFGGAWEHLAEARAATRLPILCKEFVVDELQLDAARSYGADAVLVIVRCVARERVRDLVEGARSRELE